VVLQFLPYIVITLSTLLIAIRTIAIWNKRKAIIAVVAGLWIVNLAFLIQGKSLTTFLQMYWGPNERGFVLGAARVRD